MISVHARSDPTSGIEWFGRLAVVALAYSLAGRVSLFLAVPPGFSTAIWPPAGIALALMLVWGRRIWPGVFLGSFAVNLWVSADGVLAGEARVVAACGLIAGGAVAQTFASSWLLGRFCGTPVVLTETRNVVRFFLLGGAVGCLVNSVLGPSALVVCGIIGPAQFPFNAWNWWVGDTIGVLIAAPMILIWSSYNGSVWHAYRRGITVTVLLASLGVIVMFFFGSKLELQRIEAEFRKSAGSIAGSIQGELDNAVRAVRSLQSLFDSSGFVEADEFQVFATRMLLDHPSISALSWNPYLEHDDRATFERERLSGAGAQRSIYELSNGTRVTASGRDEYVVVEYIEPREDHGVAVGFDTLSNPARRRSIERARDLARPVATPTLQLVQSERRRPGMLIFAPVFEGSAVPETVEQRRHDLEGFVVSVVFIDSLLGAALERVESDHLALQINEADRKDGREVIVSNGPSRPLDAPALVTESTVSFAGRRWTLSFAAGDDYVTAARAPGVWFMLAAGLALCAILSGFLLILSGHAHRSAVRAAHDDLTGLVNRREFEARMARAIAQSRNHSARHALCFFDLDRFKSVNDEAGHAAGDALLKEIARIVCRRVRDRDTLARLGGDEFGLLLEHCTVSDARRIAERIVDDVGQFDFKWGERVFRVGVSIGISGIDPSTRDPAAALQHADTACYAAKRSGGGCVLLHRDVPATTATPSERGRELHVG